MACSARDKAFRVLSAALLLAVTVTCFEAGARTIEAEGVGYNRDGAVQAALRSAVEQCVGMSVNSQTLVQNAVLVSDKILTHASGYVSSHQVISQGVEFGLVKVRVSADVAMGKLEDDLSAQKLLYEIKNKPRLMVVLDERIEDKEMLEKTATFKFEEVLLAHQFIVVEPEQYEKLKAAESASDMATQGFREGADLIIRGKVQVSKPTPKMIYGAQFYSVPVAINARIVRADNGQIIVSKTLQIKKNSQEPESAARFGLSVGGEALAQALVDSLNAFWRSEAYNENRVEMVVDGCSDKELTALETAFRGFSFTRSILLRYLEKGSALYDLELRGTVQEIRDALSKDTRLGLSIASLTANRIVLWKGGGAQPPAFEQAATADMQIDALRIQDVFPARLRYYESHPLARVAVRSAGREADGVKLSVGIPDIMTLSADTMIGRMPANVSRDFELSLMLDGGLVMRNAEPRTVYGQATISYKSGSGMTERHLTAPVRVFDKNAMDWSELPAIGGFITYRATAITDLAVKAIRSVAASDNVNRDLVHALSIFEAVHALGISYVKDPASQPGGVTLDQVQFPVETLIRTSGDCDDLAVLYAALLESVGISTAIISYPDHVLVMFDTGIFRKSRTSLSSDSVMTIEHGGTLWIPVETTMLARGFADAWRTAAVEFHNSLAEGQSVSITEVSKAWETYPPVPLPESPDRFEPKGLADLAAVELRKLEATAHEDAEKRIAALKARLASPTEDQAAIHNTIGILNVKRNRFDDAAVSFSSAMKKRADPRYASNLACALLLSGQDVKARDLLDRTYRQDPTGRIAVNRALCMFVNAQSQQQIDAFVAALKQAAAMMPDKQDLARALGLDLFGDRQETKAAEKEAPPTQKEINLRRLKELIRKRVLAAPPKGSISGTTSETSGGTKLTGTTTETSSGTVADQKPPVVMPFGGIRGADPTQVSKVKDLLYWFE